jgi:hypothetical protein
MLMGTPTGERSRIASRGRRAKPFLGHLVAAAIRAELASCASSVFRARSVVSEGVELSARRAYHPRASRQSPQAIQTTFLEGPMAAAKVKAKSKVAMSEIRVSVASNTSFDKLVAVLKGALTVPELPGFKGCRPCLSGLDRFVLEDIVMKGLR